MSDKDLQRLTKCVLYVGHLKPTGSSRMNSWVAVNEIEGVFRTGYFVRGLMLFLGGHSAKLAEIRTRGTLKSGGISWTACVSLESTRPCSSDKSP